MFRCRLTLMILAFTSSSGWSIERFELPDANNQSVVVAPSAGIAGNSEGQLTVICFLGTECPLAKLYAPRLSKMAEEFPEVRFFGINSNRQDSLEELGQYVADHAIPFPVLKDFRNEVADQFGAKRTPEVFVLDGDFRVRYRGRIDDQYLPGVSRLAAEKHELREALVELLAGKEVTHQLTDAVGCIIGRVREPVVDNEINYCNQVSRLLQQHCVECHRTGEIGPFRLDDYEEVVGWGEMMLEVVEEGRMPPWHANPEIGEFENSRHMPDTAKTTLRAWVDAGMPYGNPKDLPPPLKTTDNWRLPHQPDLVLSMSQREFMVPEDGTVEYQYFVVDPGFTEDKWITGAQIVPGNASVVHHSIVFVRPPDGSRFRGIGWLTAYVPGSRAGTFPPGHAIKVPAKSKLVFQQHYTPNGTEQSDLTTLGLTFGEDAEITHEVYTLVGIDQQFEIPPHAKNHIVRNQVHNLPRQATLRSIMPHMHFRGKSFRLFAKQGDRETIMLDVPRYDFNWQHAYQLKDPVPLASLDKLHFEVAFDNSAANPVNPNPDEHVTWGDQTWEEMAVAFFEVSEPRDKSKEVTDKSVARDEAKTTPEQERKIAAEVERILGRFDHNQDGIVEPEETTTVFRRYAFWQIDENRDRKITRKEIEESARWRVN